MFKMKSFFTFLLLVSVTAVFAAKQDFSRYQSIIDRQPFGQPPVGFNPQKMASEVSKSDGATAEQLTQEQEEIQKAVGFSMLNVETDGSVMIGFSDRSNPSTPKHYYLAVGDTQDGWWVKACDPTDETMTIEKDGIEVTLKLGENSNPAPASKSGRGARPMTLQAKSGNAVPSITSFKGRRERRRMEEAKAKADAEAHEAERKRMAEEKAAHEAAEKEARELERAEQRQQLLAIQEELRKAREEKERQKAAEEPQAEPMSE